MKKLYSNTYLMRFLTAQLPSLALFIMILSNQVLRKHVKLASSQNVNQYDYINISKHSRVYLMGAFLAIF